MSKNRFRGKSRAFPPGPTRLLLLFVDEMSPAVLLPATFVRLSAEWLLFAEADGLDATATYSSLDQRILHRICAVGAQGQVIFGRAALVAMALYGYVNVGVLLEELRIGL